MIKTIFSFILLLLTTSLNAQEVAQEVAQKVAQKVSQQVQHDNEIDLITVPLENYLKGHIRGDKNMLGKALHSDGKLSYLRDGLYSKLEFPDYLSRMKLRDTKDGVQRTPHIKSIEVTGKVAMAKLVLDYSSILFTDYMTLLKINGQWKITNKIAFSIRDPKNNKVESINLAAVMAPLKSYMMAYKTGNAESLQAVFHKEAKVMSIIEGEYKSIAVGDFNPFAGQGKVTVQSQIQSIDVTGNAAVGKVILNYSTSKVTNYLSLLKIEGEWKIVNKAFYISDDHST